ncbi:hypothetical protein TthSNM66_11710 [Thermus thermophilus]|nr:hypothetical protein [Thermus thermophilus]BDG26535.1 hypothetical protein TthSNM66_11710 [Thermus thermophilus]
MGAFDDEEALGLVILVARAAGVEQGIRAAIEEALKRAVPQNHRGG